MEPPKAKALEWSAGSITFHAPLNSGLIGAERKGILLTLVVSKLLCPCPYGNLTDVSSLKIICDLHEGLSGSFAAKR